MKQRIFIILFLGVFINIFSQNMWEYKYLVLYSPTSTRYTVDSAKQIILNRKLCDPNYDSAVEFLYYWHSHTEKQFLLENLNTKINPSLRGVENSCQWLNFHTDTYYRGLLGDTTAIERMDSIAKYGHKDVKNIAVRNLAEIGRFDYYDYVKQLYLSDRDRYDGLLTMYGDDIRFKDEVLSLLEEQAREYDLNDEFQRANMLGLITTYILKLDRQKAIEILDEYFRNTVDSLRWQFYEELKYLDKEGQTERTKYFLLNSQDDRYLGTYLPRFMYITQYKIYSSKFLSLNFIKFLKEYEANSGTSRYRAIKKYLLYFKPAKPDTTVATTSMLDTLTSYTNQCYGYEWLKDEAYKTELLNKITTAKNYLNASDSVNCAIEIQTFQNSVNQVYQDSAGSYPKYVSNEGYKFLYYYAQYILDKLPEPVEGLPVKLEDSQGNLLQGGSLQYYDSGWKDATDNGDGTFTVQTEKSTVSLKMNYAGTSQQLNNVTVGPDIAVFQTANATVKLLNSQGTPVDTGTVKYYASGWKDLGTTVNGIAAKELLPRKYTFKMYYAGGSINKDQDISQDSVVVFQTVKAEVQLKDSQGNLLSVPSGDGGSVKYYASGWKDFGTAANGSVTKELLPRKYTFKMYYAGGSINKDQDIGQDSVVVFQTVKAEVQLKDSQGNLLDGGEVKYYASSWKDFGTAANGEVTKELLPREYSFRMNYSGASIDQKQDIGIDPVVVFQTVNAIVQLKDSQGNPLDGATASFYAKSWQEIGATVNGEVSKELLPRGYTFRMTYGYISNDKSQDIGSSPNVMFTTIPVTVSVKDSSGNTVIGTEVQYYSKQWNVIGNTNTNGEVVTEMLPKNITFRVKYNSKTYNKKQDTAENSLVEFIVE